jgi:hypothetical protein
MLRLVDIAAFDLALVDIIQFLTHHYLGFNEVRVTAFSQTFTTWGSIPGSRRFPTAFPSRSLEPSKAHSCKEKAMTVYERTVAKMQQLPDPLLQEVSDFVDFLLVKQDQTQWELWTHFRESLDLAESDFSDYLHNLETYEEGLARGDIRW